MARDHIGPAPPRRNRRRTPHAPSSGLLSLLATLASSSSAGASPISQATPPPFLCPFIENEPDTPLDRDRYRTPADIVKPTPTKSYVRRTQLPDKYEPGDDGSWRRADMYTLYGSTICLSCTASTPTPTLDPDYDASYSTADLPHPSPTTDDFLDTLPTGWKPSGPRTVDHSPIIICLSLVAAFLICSFMLGILRWRKKSHSASHTDLEMKARKKRRIDGDEDAVDQEARTKQKLWAKATARWRSNIRYAARRRRGKRLVVAPKSSQTHLPSISEHDAPEPGRVSMDSSLPPSRSPSRRTSILSLRHPSNPSTTSVESTATQHSERVTHSAADPLSAEVTSNLPPAYPWGAGGSSQGHDMKRAFHNTPSHSSEDISPPPHPSSSADENGPTYSPDECIPYVDTGAHVAVDDKAVLSRMADMASAPPTDHTTDGPSYETQVSAPVWHDEELEHFDGESHGGPCDGACTPTYRHCNSRPRSPTSLFPPPPCKGKMAAPNFYDYSYSFEEDIANLGPEAESSAPPFEEERPSAPPPLEDSEIVPSAPPLADEPEMEDSWPSAPAWDDHGGWKEPEGGALADEQLESDSSPGHDRLHGNGVIQDSSIVDRTLP